MNGAENIIVRKHFNKFAFVLFCTRVSCVLKTYVIRFTDTYMEFTEWGWERDILEREINEYICIYIIVEKIK